MYWKKNNKIVVDSQGRPISCTSCPCGSIECREAVDNAVSNLLTLKDEEQHYIWALQETYTPQYTCAVWTQDAETEEWSLVSMADGKLAVAFRVGKKVSDTAGSYARFLVYAKTLYSESLDQWLTVGCECHITGHECKHRMVSLTDFNVGGLLDVYKPEESDSAQSYEPSDACQVDKCDLAKLKLTCADTWHYGGIMHGEGFFDWWTDSRHRQQDWSMTKYLKALEWTDYEVDESDSEIHSFRMLTYIPCACDSENLVTHTLSSGEKLHSYSGICSMESNCQSQVLWTLRTLLDEEASDSDSETPNVWEEVASVATDFQCAVFENGQCVSPSTGNLCIAFARPLWLTYGGVDTYGVSLITGVTLRNTRTGRYRTIGCKCNYGDWSYWTCSQQFYEHDDVCIGGILPVAPDNCTERNACATYPCDVYRLAFQCYASWFGCTLYGEGYLQHGMDFTNYDKFSMAITGFMNESDSSSTPQKWYYYIDCDCLTGHSGTGHSGVLLSNDFLHELAGICSNPECEKMLMLLQRAQEEGWTVYGEGVLVHLDYFYNSSTQTYTFADWYVWYEYSWDNVYDPQQWTNSTLQLGDTPPICKACVDTGTQYYLVDCSCNISVVNKSTGWIYGDMQSDAPTTIPANYFQYIERDGICGCNSELSPMREFLMEYPSEFGVEEISFGNNTKYQYSLTYMGFNWDTHQVEQMTASGYNVCGGRYETPHNQPRMMFLEYRTFCCIHKLYTPDGVARKHVLIRNFYNSGANGHSPSNNFQRCFDSVSFVGKIQPFTYDADLDFYWFGMNNWWTGDCGMGCGGGTFWTREEAEEECNCTPDDSFCEPQGQSQGEDWWNPMLGYVSPPNFTKTLHTGDGVHYNAEQDIWVCDYKYWILGTSVWTKNGGRDNVVYLVQYIETNKGYIRYGVGTHEPSFLMYGINYGVYGNPNWDNWNGAVSSDTTMTCPHMDDDMHWCDPDYEWDDDDESESISDESESASN